MSDENNIKSRMPLSNVLVLMIKKLSTINRAAVLYRYINSPLRDW